MSPSLSDNDEQYTSSEDSDFAPEQQQDEASDPSESDNDDAAAKPSRPTAAGADVDDAGYDNSGDEAIIERGNKRRKRAKDKSAAFEEEGGDGGLVKTRAQRAAEKEERRYATNIGPVTVDVDAIWAEMLAGKPAAATANPDEATEDIQESRDHAVAVQDRNETQEHRPSTDAASDTIRIKRTYNFAGQVHTEEKVVARDSAEAKLFLATQGDSAQPESSPAKRSTKKAFRSAFEPLSDAITQRADLNLGVAARARAGQEAAQARKLNTVEKSRMDWAGYVDKEGIKEDLELAGRSKTSYTAREDFLARSEARREEDAKRARLAGRV